MGSPTPRYERSPRPSALFPPLAPVEFPSLVPANGQSVRCVASVVRTDSVRQKPAGFGWLAGNSKRDHESTKVRNHERRGGDGRFIRPRVFVRSCFRDCFGSEPMTPCLVPAKPFAALRLCVLAREVSELASRKGATSRRHAHNDLGDGAGVYLCIQNACRDDGVTDREEVGDQQ